MRTSLFNAYRIEVQAVKWPSKYVWKRTALVTVVAAAVSISISTGIRYLIGAEADTVTIIVRVILPFLIAIPIGLAWFSKMEQLDLSHRRLIQNTNELVRRASTDPLTGLLNRRSFVEQFNLAHLHGGGGVFCLADIDYLKSINDEYGHVVGDDVILAAAHAMTTCLGQDSLIARIGGDEFCAFLPGRSVQDIEKTAIRINDVATDDFRRRSGLDGVRVSVSFGYQISRPGQTFRDLMEQSDTNLYRKKRARHTAVDGPSSKYA